MFLSGECDDQRRGLFGIGLRVRGLVAKKTGCTTEYIGDPIVFAVAHDHK